MANKTLLTNTAKLYSVENIYYSPLAITPPYNSIPDSMYLVLGHQDPWPDDNNPPTATQDPKTLKTFRKKIFAAKRVTTNDISPVIQRVNWESGNVYDYYNDTLDTTATDSNGYIVYTYYVKNKYDQVFKCLWNNNGAESTLEPYFEPGTIQTNNIFQGSDGYKWKYIYTVETALKVKFMNSDWMPVPVGSNIPNSLTPSAGAGNIDVINITNQGTNYDPLYTTVSISGDGTGFTAEPVISGGSITDVIITNNGTNYTYANVSFVSSAVRYGNDAIAFAPVSPIGGHGYDPISELGCTHVMIAPEVYGSENGFIPTDITYHQVALLINPTSRKAVLGSAPNANGDIYKTTTDLVVSSGSGTYNNNELIYQGDNIDSASFIGTVLSFNSDTNTISVINTSGTPSTGLGITNGSTTRTVLSYTSPDFDVFSGYFMYIENRSGIQRSVDGIEQFKIVLGY